MKKALVTGITGQDGSYLTELLLDKGYEVHGIIRRSSSFSTGRIDHILKDSHDIDARLKLHYGDLIDSSSLNRILESVVPDEIYNLGAQSHVHISFQIPEYTAQASGLGTLRILDAIKDVGIKTKFYQASTSELFGRASQVPQTESTPFYPRSPYACAKLYSYWTTVNYREAYNIYACNGILFNHESPRRGETFLSRKVTRAAAKIILGKQDRLYLGNLDAQRDWGYAKEYVEAMWLMLQQDAPDDYIIATSQAHSVRALCDTAFSCLGIHLGWKGTGPHEQGFDINTGRVLIEIDPKYFRPTDVDLLIGDYGKAEARLGWSPKVSFADLIKMMVEYDLRLVKGQAATSLSAIPDAHP